MPIPLFAIMTLLLIATPSTSSAYSSLYQGSTVYSMGSVVTSYATVYANFEIELGWTPDIPYLYNESGIGVFGNVQQTPRYNMSGEALVDGVWVNSTFFDKTLVDRFVVNCTQEKAINMSSYIWVEWTAPILEGTTYGDVQPPARALGGGFWIPAGSSGVSKQWTGSDLTPLAYEMLDYAQGMGYNVYFLTFKRGPFYLGASAGTQLENPYFSGTITADGLAYFDKYVAEADERGMKIAFYEWLVSSTFWDWFFANEPTSMTKLAPFWETLATHFNGDSRVYGFGPPVANVGQSQGYAYYISQAGCNWWAPYINQFLVAVHEGDPNALAIGSPMTDMGSTATFANDYWRPTLPALTDTGPRVWRKMNTISYEETDSGTNPYYPYDESLAQQLDWMNRWDEVIFTEAITGFHSVWYWDSQTLQWLEDWMAQRETDVFPWFWESYGWKGGTYDERDTEWVRAYFTSDGTERAFVSVIRNCLKQG